MKTHPPLPLAASIPLSLLLLGRSKGIHLRLETQDPQRAGPAGGTAPSARGTSDLGRAALMKTSSCLDNINIGQTMKALESP